MMELLGDLVEFVLLIAWLVLVVGGAALVLKFLGAM